MSMLLELFGDEILNATLSQVKEKIKSLPQTIKERRSYILKDFALLTGTILKEQDFRDIDA